ncbi:hypothetical protein [Cellulosilyticum sp. I15G10I2]|uniref:hypothetical protein n=1 Tax=Cellulosilyticum sp. I15G10I2 TaxID=1892843 RepID=UPI00085C5CF3|nr:hypothetical protein [Cellulosilyticum sp. I15G10I2]
MNKCRGCTDRVLGCHSTCKSYREFRAAKEYEYKERHKSMCDWVLAKRNLSRKTMLSTHKY